MANDRTITSLWLAPAEPWRSELRWHIDQMAIEHGTPGFDPHITLTAGEVDHDVVLAAVERVARVTPPLDVVTGLTAHGTERFKAVFVELEDPRLHELAAALNAHLGLVPPEGLRPHMSLLYAADLPAPTRSRLAAAHSFRGRTIRFDTIVASVPGAGVDDVARWQSTVVRPLTGARPPV